MASEIEHRGSVLFGVPRGMTGQLASQMIDEGVIEELMPPQKSYRERRRKEVRRVLFNLIRAQSLSRAHSRRITLAIPLAMIHRNEKEYHRVSYRGVKSVIEAFSGAGLIGRERGKPFPQCPTRWKRKCVRENNLRGKMAEIWARGKLEEEINAYLDESTHIGADVEILVEETSVVLKDNDGGYIRTQNSRKARRMRETVEEVNEAVPQSGVCLTLPLSTLSPHRPSHASSIRLHTSPRRRREEVHMVADSTLDKAHAEVKRRCPTAWSWNHRLSDDGRHIIYDIPNLALRYNRSFVRGSWDCGGRFYAPVQNIPSDWRKHMRIGGEPVVELDYDNLHIAMLYAEEGKRLGGDAYDITADFNLGDEMDKAVGLTEEERQLYRKRQRTVVKRALNTLINAENYQSAYEALKHTDWTEKIGVPLADGVFKPLVRALRGKHRAIEGHLHSDRGIRLQRKDSDLARRIMTETGAIGIHDGFVIEASREEELRSVMKRAFAEEYDGYEIGVSREFEPLPSENGAQQAHTSCPENNRLTASEYPTPPKENRSIRPHPHNEQQEARREGTERHDPDGGRVD